MEFNLHISDTISNDCDSNGPIIALAFDNRLLFKLYNIDEPRNNDNVQHNVLNIFIMIHHQNQICYLLDFLHIILSHNIHPKTVTIKKCSRHTKKL